ncbi:hypothetical protein RJT34_15013 [Clitoria ternatea]|uniref:Uncharacterized protein n=1 Tax=Clitoria ternatea TaxID=43366 RepID=A0AAN9PNH4_CLITE
MQIFISPSSLTSLSHNSPILGLFEALGCDVQLLAEISNWVCPPPFVFLRFKITEQYRVWSTIVFEITTVENLDNLLEMEILL